MTPFTLAKNSTPLARLNRKVAATDATAGAPRGFTRIVAATASPCTRKNAVW